MDISQLSSVGIGDVVNTRRQGETALTAEAKKLNASSPCVRVFDPVQRTLGAGCNWTATDRAVGSRAALHERETAPERGRLGFRWWNSNDRADDQSVFPARRTSLADDSGWASLGDLS